MVLPAAAVNDADVAAREESEAVLDDTSVHRATIGCVIPARNEEDSIAQVIESLLGQTRVPDVVHVVVNNTSDATVKTASQHAGPHEITTVLGEQFTEVFVHDIGNNPDKKAGALNYGHTLVEGYDYLLGVDGDSVADARAVEYLEAEATSDTRIGGVSAICSIDDKPIRGLVPRFLITGQRSQFAAFNMHNLLRGRNTTVLGGQFSIFSTQALRDVMTQNHRSTPWVEDSEVEDSLLTLQIKSAGYLTRISPFARADVGGMTTMRTLAVQQVTWTYGAIELMWPGQRGDTNGQPFHPNLRMQWLENLRMFTSMFVRPAFLLLVAGSLSIGAFAVSAWWLIPVGVVTLLNLRIALSMRDRNVRDILFAVTLLPAELYLWLRLGSFARSWMRFLSRRKVDDWAMQSRAERRSRLGRWMPLVVIAGVLIALAVVWSVLGPAVQSTILGIGWPILAVVIVLQTLWTFRKLIRRQHGYKV